MEADSLCKQMSKLLIIILGVSLCVAKGDDQNFNLAQKILREKGQIESAIDAFSIGWKNDQDLRCLEGLGLTHIKIDKQKNLLKDYRDDLIVNIKRSRVIRMIVLNVAISEKDEQLFKHGVSGLKWNEVEGNAMLTNALALGSLAFLSEPGDPKNGELKNEGEVNTPKAALPKNSPKPTGGVIPPENPEQE